MKHTQCLTRLIPVIAAMSMAAVPALRAQTLAYSNNFDSPDTATNFVVNVVGAGYSAATFGYDYSAVGIPSAPHSTGGTTTGLKLIANNLADGFTGGTFPAGVSVSPTNFAISDNFVMHCDMWLNYPGNGSGSSGNGTTQIGGAGYGTAGLSAQAPGQADSVFCGVTVDGGSSADYRMYAPSAAPGYPDGAYQITGDSTSGYVYSRTNRNATPYYSPLFPGGDPCPSAQTNLYPQQVGLTAPAGTIAFAWHDVSLQKVGNVITYSIDGKLVATVNAVDAGTLGGQFLTFLMSDTTSAASTDPNATNLLFTLVDNVVVTNYPNVVTVSATQPNASEVGPTPGVFTVTRTSSGAPLTVYYTMTGTATNGVNYQTLSGSVTFSALDTSTNITLTPIDDGIPEATLTAIMNITPSANYVGAGSAIVYIADGDTPTIDITCTRKQAYDRYTNDFILYHLNRRGLLTSPDLTVNLTYSGTAIGGTDYTVTNSILLTSGASGVDFPVYPIHNPAYTGNREVTINVAAGSGYAVGTGPATGTIVDSEYAPATLLATNSLTDPADVANWAITYGTGDPTNNSANYEADFGFDLNSAYGSPVPPPPGGANNVLHLTCNKDVSPGAAGAVNAYYTNIFLSGNYAVRFNMNLIEGSDLGVATEGAVFGINHSGTYSNWWYGSGPLAPETWSSDGEWYFVCVQGAAVGSGDYQEFTGAGGTNGNPGWTRLSSKYQSSFVDAFKNNPGPFTTIASTGYQVSGMPANAAQIAYDASTWSDVEIRQSNNIVTMSINHTPIFTYTNTTVWTNGYLMLGYSDPYSSIGSPDGSVYYANLQVVQLPTPTVITITAIGVSGGVVTITFATSNSSDTTSSFEVLSASDVKGTYSNTGAVINSMGAQVFQATLPLNGAQQFYRISHPNP